MSLTKKAEKFNSFLKNKLEKNVPLIYIDENTILFKQYKIALKPNIGWSLSKIDGDLIYVFKIKSTALIAASYHSLRAFKKMDEIKLLDSSYSHNMIDIDLYKNSIFNTTDEVKKEILLSRLDLAKTRAQFYKKEIMKHVQCNNDKY